MGIVKKIKFAKEATVDCAKGIALAAFDELKKSERVQKLLGRSDIIDNDSIYMRRWRVLHTPLFGIRVHNIVRSDKDFELHDHPFTFVSVILKGGYIEETVDGEKKYYPPGSVLLRQAEVLHRLDLLKKDGVFGKGEEVQAWTLVFRGPMRRQWGFLNVPFMWTDAAAFWKHQESVKHRRMRERAGGAV